ncbi:MAG: hypothetical protein JWM34_2380 [Ilumatobacteraceae bacterium]|nr:hypothetical protein [Ilumatobacteraceae bacterium]
MSDTLHALHASVERLRAIVESLEPGELTTQAYPTEWTIADTLSHLGSGAVIMRAGVEAASTGTSVADGFNQSVWDEWNAKSPADQAAGVLVADHALLETIGALTDEQRAAFQFSLGPMTLDLDGFLGMRLNEHALHTWDVEVVFDPAATVSDQAAGIMLGSVPMIAGFAAKDDGVERRLVVVTSDPTHVFAVTTGAGTVKVVPHDEEGGGPVLALPAESFVRLVYGRLDADHLPAGVDAAAVADLRRVFPGF